VGGSVPEWPSEQARESFLCSQIILNFQENQSLGGKSARSFIDLNEHARSSQ
jgi:hypothetical protein